MVEEVMAAMNPTEVEMTRNRTARTMLRTLRQHRPLPHLSNATESERKRRLTRSSCAFANSQRSPSPRSRSTSTDAKIGTCSKHGVMSYFDTTELRHTQRQI